MKSDLMKSMKDEGYEGDWDEDNRSNAKSLQQQIGAKTKAPLKSNSITDCQGVDTNKNDENSNIQVDNTNTSNIIGNVIASNIQANNSPEVGMVSLYCWFLVDILRLGFNPNLSNEAQVLAAKAIFPSYQSKFFVDLKNLITYSKGA